MKIDIIISGDDIRKEKLQNKVAVVIDIFRATSVMVTALSNGCKEIRPYLTVEEAREEANRLGRDNCILGGERNAIKIDGFDLSNSPLEYKKEIVKDKTVIMTTTNGTKTLTRSNEADKILIAAMINANAVAKKIIKLNQDVVIINAGTNGNFSMDDFICSGYIIDCIIREKNHYELTDISKTAMMIYNNNQDILSYVKEALHFEVMKSLELDKDIEYCIKKDIFNIVPEYSCGVITLK